MNDSTSSHSDLRYSGLAVVSFILGVLSPLWLVFGLSWGILGLLAVFAGRRAKKEIDLAPSELEGRALANGGMIAGAIGFTTAMFLLIVVVTSPAV